MYIKEKFNLLFDPKFDKKLPKIVLNDRSEISLSELFLRELKQDEILGFRAYRSKLLIKLPFIFSSDLAYLLGCILGDGCIRTPVKRKKGGHYFSIEIKGKYEFLEMLSERIFNIFNYKRNVAKVNKKKNTWELSIDSIIIYRFFNRILEIPFGPKAGKMPWLKYMEVPNIFKNILAGLIDTDGYYYQKGNRLYLIQKDKKFLEKIKQYAKKLLKIDLNGPRINRKIDGKIVGWELTLNGYNEIKNFIKKVPLKFNCPRKSDAPVKWGKLSLDRAAHTD